MSVEKKDKVSQLLTFHLSKKGLPQIANLIATDFMGVRPVKVPPLTINVINSDVTWDAFQGATYYQVFINDTITNDEAGDGKLTKTTFRTATGLIDLDALMADEEKDIRITKNVLTKTL